MPPTLEGHFLSELWALVRGLGLRSPNKLVLWSYSAVSRIPITAHSFSQRLSQGAPSAAVYVYVFPEGAMQRRRASTPWGSQLLC